GRGRRGGLPGGSETICRSEAGQRSQRGGPARLEPVRGLRRQEPRRGTLPSRSIPEAATAVRRTLRTTGRTVEPHRSKERGPVEPGALRREGAEEPAGSSGTGSGTGSRTGDAAGRGPRLRQAACRDVRPEDPPGGAAFIRGNEPGGANHRSPRPRL